VLAIIPAVLEIAVETPMGRSTLKKANHESTPINAPTKYGDQRFICKYRTLHSSIRGRAGHTKTLAYYS
jgi:hypothetical protein